MLFWSLLLRCSCVQMIACIIFSICPKLKCSSVVFAYLIPGYFFHQNWLETCESLLQYQKEFALDVDPENTDYCVFLPICTINFWLLNWAATYWILWKYSTHIQVAHHLFCPTCSRRNRTKEMRPWLWPWMDTYMRSELEPYVQAQCMLCGTQSSKSTSSLV